MKHGLNPLRAVLLLACCALVACDSTSSQPPSQASAPVANFGVVVDKQPTPQLKMHTVRKEPAPAEEAPLEEAGVEEETPVELPTIPEVFLSTAHAKLCYLNVGETISNVSLPRFGGSSKGALTNLESLRGKQATVVLFWQPDRWMAHMALADLQHDVVARYEARQVGVVGIAVQQSSGTIRAALSKAKASFPQLLDSDGKLFATVGSYALPRVYVLGSEGKVVWFDIEYSESTHRELQRTLAVLTAE